MVPKIVTFFIIACAVVLTCGQNVSIDPQPMSTVSPTKSTTPSTNKTTTPEPTTTSQPTTTSKPTTTSQPTTTSKPTTTSQPPTTTTSIPTTTGPYPTPTTSTEPPTTPKPSPTTPTPKPSPKPPQKPDVGKWNVTDHNITCILVDMAVQLNISYIGNDNKTHYTVVNIPKDADATGTCGNSSQILDLEWKENNKSFGNLNLVFLKNDSTKHFMISTINLTVVPDDSIFPGIQDNKSSIVLYTNKEEFSTSLSKSYRCEKVQSFALKYVDGKNETDSEMSVSHVHLEAFHAKKDRNFGSAEDCEPSSSPDIVPIAVGCALVGLVAIVLIAYLVGRRRSQARGYLSIVRSDSENDIPLQHVSQWKKCWK